MIAMTIGMFVAFIMLSLWVSPTIKRRIVGYGFFADIMVHVILQGMFGGDAAGRGGLLLAGVMINICMHAYRFSNGYEKLTLTGWKRFVPEPKAKGKP